MTVPAPRDVDVRLGRRLGPYVIEAWVGDGAMGVVYRARDSSSGVAAAVKVVRLRSPHLLAAFRREVHALKQLDHPGIVKLLAADPSDETPWYAMELVAGHPLSHFMPRTDAGAASETAPPQSGVTERPAAPPAPMPFSERLRVVRKICDALAFMHGRGLVHRDLKPKNILIRPDGEPVIADFGIVEMFAGVAGREVLDLAMPRVGTLAYMAPEQQLGRAVDARADLFSLGCILHELLTGALPFGPSGIGRYPRTELARAPIPIPELESIVARLLARDPRDRIGYAEDVAKVLGRFLGEEPASPAKRNVYLYRAELAARTGLLRRMDGVFDAAFAGRGANVLLSGESGVGKTRLLMEIAARAADRDMAVITGDCSPAGSSSGASAAPSVPLLPFGGLLRSLIDACKAGADSAGPLDLIKRYGSVLTPYEPDLAKFLLASDFAQADVLPPEAARRRVVSTLRNLLRDYSPQRPLLLCLDDLQWADDLSLELFSSLAADPSGPIVVVATCRVEEMAEPLRRWSNEPRVVHERLPCLDREAIEEMIGGMLALPSAPSDVLDAVYEASGGNPFFIAEYLRAAVGEGLLDRDDSGQWRFRMGEAGSAPGVTLPRTIAALVERRLAGLDSTSLAVLFAGAVLGRQFDVELLADTAHVDATSVLDAYRVLREGQIWEEGPGGSMRFVHEYLRETAYTRIAGSERTALHRRAAAAVERRYPGGDRESHFAALGHHHAEAGDAQPAAQYFEQAGDHARASYANQDALRLYRLALVQLGSGEEGADATCRLEEAIGDVLLIQGDAGGAREAFGRSLDRGTGLSRVSRARRRRKLARTWERDHRHADALSSYVLAEAELGAPPPDGEAGTAWWRELVEIRVEKAWDLYFLNEVEQLTQLVDQVRPIVERYSGTGQRGRFFLAAAHAEIRRRRYRVGEDSLQYTRGLLAAAHASGELQLLAVAQFSHAFLLLMGGDEAAAEPLFVEALQGAERLGDHGLQARFLSYHALLHRRLGRLDRARATAERAVFHASSARMLDYLGMAEATFAWVALREGRGSDVEGHAARALSAWNELRATYVFPFEWLARMPLAARSLELGARGAAVEQWRLLLDERQQQLPDALERTIRSALEAADKMSFQERAREVVALATALKFL
jgi:hypothetical protein